MDDGSEEEVLNCIRKALYLSTGKEKLKAKIKVQEIPQEIVQEDDILKTMVMQNIQFQQLMMSSIYLSKNESNSVSQVKEKPLESKSTQTEEELKKKSYKTKTINKEHNVEEVTKEIQEEEIQIDPEVIQERIENTRSRSKIIFIAVYFIQILKKIGSSRRRLREFQELEIINTAKCNLQKYISENSYFSNAVKEIECLESDLLVQDSNLFTFFKAKSKNILFITPIINLIISGIENLKDKDIIRAIRLLISKKIVKSYYFEGELEILPLGTLYLTL